MPTLTLLETRSQASTGGGSSGGLGELLSLPAGSDKKIIIAVANREFNTSDQIVGFEWVPEAGGTALSFTRDVLIGPNTGSGLTTRSEVWHLDVGSIVEDGRINLIEDPPDSLSRLGMVAVVVDGLASGGAEATGGGANSASQSITTVTDGAIVVGVASHFDQSWETSGLDAPFTSISSFTNFGSGPLHGQGVYAEIATAGLVTLTIQAGTSSGIEHIALAAFAPAAGGGGGDTLAIPSPVSAQAQPVSASISAALGLASLTITAALAVPGISSDLTLPAVSAQATPSSFGVSSTIASAPVSFTASTLTLGIGENPAIVLDPATAGFAASGLGISTTAQAAVLSANFLAFDLDISTGVGSLTPTAGFFLPSPIISASVAFSPADLFAVPGTPEIVLDVLPVTVRIKRAKARFLPGLLRANFTPAAEQELNPFAAEIPSAAEDLPGYLQEQTRILRETHEREQFGEVSLPAELLFEVHETPVVTPGTRTAFLHKEFGVIRAEYVRFAEITPTLPGSPVGVSKEGDGVTNDISASSAFAVLGLMAAPVLPMTGQYGWVVLEGKNLQRVQAIFDDGETGVTGLELAWGASGLLTGKLLSAGRTVAAQSTTRAVTDFYEPGELTVELRGEEGRRRFAQATTRVDTLEIDLGGILSRIVQLETVDIGFAQTFTSLQAQQGEILALIEDTRTVFVTADKALAQRIETLGAQFTSDISAAIGVEQTARATADQALAEQLTGLRAELTFIDDAQEQRLATAESSITTFVTKQLALSREVIDLNASLHILDPVTGVFLGRVDANAFTTLEARVTTTESGIVANATAITNLQTSLTDAQSGVTANAFAISTLDARVTSAEGTLTVAVSDITALEASVFDPVTGLDSKASLTVTSAIEGDVTGLEARFGVTLDVNGHITGFSQNNDGQTGEFIVVADKFKVANPGNPDVIPFSVVGNEVFINKATLGDVTADDIAEGILNKFAAESGADITSKRIGNGLINGSFEAGAEGWALDNATIHAATSHSGTQSLRMTERSGNDPNTLSNFIATAPGKRWKISGWAARDTPLPAGNSVIQVREYNGLSSLLSTVVLGISFNKDVGGWQFKEAIYTTQNSAAQFFRIDLVASTLSDTGAWLFDDIAAAEMPANADIDALQTVNAPAEAGATVGAVVGSNLRRSDGITAIVEADLAAAFNKITSANISTFMNAAAIGTAFIQDAAIVDAKIANLSAAKITTGFLSADRISIDGIILDSIGGVLTVNDDSIVTGKLAPNAVTAPWKASQTGTQAITPSQNTWVPLSGVEIDANIPVGDTADVELLFAGQTHGGDGVEYSVEARIVRDGVTSPALITFSRFWGMADMATAGQGGLDFSVPVVEQINGNGLTSTYRVDVRLIASDSPGGDQGWEAPLSFRVRGTKLRIRRYSR